MKQVNSRRSFIISRRKLAGKSLGESPTLYSGGSAKLSRVYEGNTEAFRKDLSYFISVEDASTALSIGVVTIEGKIYWTATTLKLKT